jgi:hypothetical protein
LSSDTCASSHPVDRTIVDVSTLGVKLAGSGEVVDGDVRGVNVLIGDVRGGPAADVFDYVMEVPHDAQWRSGVVEASFTSQHIDAAHRILRWRPPAVRS